MTIKCSFYKKRDVEMIEIKNEELKYCLDRLNNMSLNTDADIIFQVQCTYALWLSIYKQQPELDKLDYFNQKQIESMKDELNIEKSKIKLLQSCLEDEKKKCLEYKKVAIELLQTIDNM